VSEEAGRQQLARMMDEQLTQNQTIETLRRQVEISNNTARDTQAVLRTQQEQHHQHSFYDLLVDSIDWICGSWIC